MENEPLLLFPFSQTRIHKVEPGTCPVNEIIGILPFGLLLSSQAMSTMAPQVPVYTAIPPSSITPVWVSKVMLPVAGTTAEYHTSPPLYPAQPGAGGPAVLVAEMLVVGTYVHDADTVSAVAAQGLSLGGGGGTPGRNE